jgi:transcriptional regulator with XRE-family HTH domain
MARLTERGLNQKQLVALCGWADNAGASKLSRALNGEVTTLETIEAVAKALGIPRPFVVLDNEEDALLVEGQLAVRKGLRDLKR